MDPTRLKQKHKVISIKLLNAESEALLTHKHVWDEIERISVNLGRDFKQFIVSKGDHLYFEAAEGTLDPRNWYKIPPYGDKEGPADGPDALALFFLTITTMPFAEHHIGWADFSWECFMDRVGAIIEAFRGSGKSIFMRILMVYLMGLYPKKSSLIIRSADIASRKTAEGIAKIISSHQGWKLWFKDIQPKSKPGQSGGEWSATAGYSVIDLAEDHDEWVAMEAARTSPSLTKFGLGSKSVLGSRVTLAMLADDLHDEENSESVVQLHRMVTRFQGIVENSRTPQSRLVIIGTPWSLEDLLQQLPRTGEYRKTKTPITMSGTWDPENIDAEGNQPTWGEHYDRIAIQKLYNKDLTAGKIEFKRNQLLDLEADIAVQLRWYKFSNHKIEDNWFKRIGIDFAELESGASGAGRSYLSVAVTAQEPISGVWIIIDGFLGQVTQEVAENVIVDIHEKHGGREFVEVVCMEAIGGGAVFEQYMARMHREMRIIGEKGGGVSKEVRWERMLAPQMGRKKILVSDEETPFLDKVRQALKQYPRIAKRGDWAADIFDSLVWAHFYAFLETGDPLRRGPTTQPEEDNPFYAFGNAPGGGVYEDESEDN